jgi:hypothetical protein
VPGQGREQVGRATSGGNPEGAGDQEVHATDLGGRAWRYARLIPLRARGNHWY